MEEQEQPLSPVLFSGADDKAPAVNAHSGQPAIPIDKTIDARGMACPGPLMNLIGAIRPGQVGQVFEVLSSDEGSKTDIPAWVAKAKHELVEIVQDHGYTHFVVRKAR
jgi:TusA-related sulfurtransferase